MNLHEIEYSGRENPDVFHHHFDANRYVVTKDECNCLSKSYFINKIIPLLTEFKDLNELDISAIQSTGKEHYLGYIPSEIFNLTSLKKLNIRCLDLVNIPSDISKLVNLEEIDLRGNLELKSLPDELLSLPKLKTILISTHGKLDIINAKFKVDNDVIDLQQSVLL